MSFSPVWAAAGRQMIAAGKPGDGCVDSKKAAHSSHRRADSRGYNARFHTPNGHAPRTDCTPAAMPARQAGEIKRQDARGT